jgi:hypothetical protein
MYRKPYERNRIIQARGARGSAGIDIAERERLFRRGERY